MDLAGNEAIEIPDGRIEWVTVLLEGHRLCRARLDQRVDLRMVQAVLQALDTEPGAWREIALSRQWTRPILAESLHEVCVVLCGGRSPEVTDPTRFPSVGRAEVHRVGSSWAEVEAVLSRTARGLVVCFAPGVVPTEEWLSETVVAFDAPRVGVVLGALVPELVTRPPLTLHGPSDASALPGGTDVLGFRREAYRCPARLPFVPVDWRTHALAAAERAIRDGWLLARQDAAIGRIESSRMPRAEDTLMRLLRGRVASVRAGRQ